MSNNLIKMAVSGQSDKSQSWQLETELYLEQSKHWPRNGQHIMAQFDETSVVVYQAFKKSIATYAVENQRYVILLFFK